MEAGRMAAIKYNVHGVLQDKEPERLKEISKKLALPVHLMLLNLDGNMNIAMSIRTAAVLGCSDVWIIGRRKYDARPEVGAKNYVNLHKLEGIDPETFFKEHDLLPLLIEQGGAPLEEYNFKPIMNKKICFVMGSESHGLPKSWLKLDFPRLSISQYGLIRSLNVSIAASIVMYEYMRQWRTARKDI
jgi:tRNA G18 (ribose-2'-O)-methylase SpoU